MKKLHEQYRIRNNGDNGVLRSMSNLNNVFDLWYQKLLAHMQSEQKGLNKSKLGESEWSSFYQAIDEWILCLEKTLKLIGMNLKFYLKKNKSFFEN